jgi:putative MATE family efflux protein
MKSNFILRFAKLFREALSDGNYDYTSGSIRRSVILLAIPMMLEMSLESVFAVVDIYFVNGLGKHAVSIVGLTEAVLTLVYSVAIGLSAAATAIVSRRVGEKDPKGAASAAKQALLLSGIVIVIMSIAGVFYAEQILEIMGAEPQAIKEGIGYTRVMAGGTGVIFLLFMINGIFRGAGNASIAMRSLWIANGFNILLCPLMIYGVGSFEGFGVTGAAIATTVGRGIGVLYQLKYLFFHDQPNLPMRNTGWKLNNDVVKSLSTIAGPATSQFIIQSASWIFLAAIVARSGSDASAGYQTAIRLIMFFMLPAWGISNAAATLVGQNLGASRPDRAEQSVKTIMLYNTIFLGVVSLLVLIFAWPMMHFFIADTNSLQFAIGIEALRVISLGYVLYGVGMVLMQAFNGAGDSKTPTYVCLLGFWVFQIPFAWIMSIEMGLGPLGVFMAVPVAEAIISVVYWVIFKQGKWKTVQV